jgi:hypothetical protein
MSLGTAKPKAAKTAAPKPQAPKPQAPKPKAPKPPPAPDALVREQAGRYRSGDNRFTVRQDGGQWFVTDSQQTNEFGLEMVLGPFATVALAREQMALQREHPAGAEPGSKVRSIARARAVPRPKRQPALAKATSQPRHAPSPAPEPEPEPESPAPEYAPADWSTTGDERDQVAQQVRLINDAWMSGHPDQMRDALDVDVIFVQPGFGGRETGRDAAIASYREFVTQAALRRYEESELSIDLSGHTAVATYRWRIAYAMDGKDYDETGRDLFVFDRFGTRWRLVWRLLIPDPGKS